MSSLPALHISFNILGHICYAIFPDEPGLAGFIEAKDDGSGGDQCSCKMTYSSTCHHHFHQRSIIQTVTINKTIPNFLQTGCPSCHPTNSIKALSLSVF